jgi:hypothetical protein
MEWTDELELEGVSADVLKGTRVHLVMPDDQVGRWKLAHFSVSDRDYTFKLVQIDVNNPNDARRAALEKRRAVPPGEYICLQRRMTEAEIDQVIRANDLEGHPRELVIERFLPEDRQYVPIMSDTPAEIVEQQDALRDATGRVLITGLGLACIPHALLRKPDVTHIDIIEIDPEVIALTGKYLLAEAERFGKTVEIHQGSAIDPDEIFGTSVEWDYAWHDIWSQISDDNLDDSTAEHGISYYQIFDLYSLRVGDQGAWAYAEALEKLALDQQATERELEFIRKVRDAPFEDQVKLLHDKCIRDSAVGMSDDTPISDDIRRVFDPEGKFEAHLRERLQDPAFWDDLYARIADLERKPNAQSFPNAHLTSDLSER